MLPPLLSRDDIFISYSRADGAAYATGLADRLTAKGFSCFLDRLGTEPDEQIPASLRRRIRSCTMTVLVGTERGAASAFVEQEIAEFLHTRRNIVPIDFGGAVGRARWYRLIPGLAAEPERNPQAAETGEPSENVIGRIEKSFRYTRRNQHMLRVFWATIVAFLAVIGLGLGATYWSTVRANEARGWAELRSAIARRMSTLAEASRKDAVRQQELADAQKELARLAGIETERQQRLARQYALTARERLIDLSQEQGRFSLLNGNPAAGLVYLNDAYGQRPNDEALRFLVAAAKRSLVPTFQGAPLESRFRAAATGGAFDLSRSFGLDLHYAAYSPDGTRVVTAADDAIKVWDARTGTLQLTIAERAFFADFVEGGAYLLSQQSSTVKLWDAHTGQLVRALPDLQGNDSAQISGQITTLSPDEKRLMRPGDPTRVFEVASGKMLFELRPESDRGFGGHTMARFSPDGATIATIHNDAVATLWCAADGARIATLAVADHGVESAAFSPDGKRLVTTIANEAKVWDAATGALLHTLQGHTGTIRTSVFSPGGKFLATAGEDRGVRIWDARTDFKLLHRLEEHRDEVTHLAFSPHGERLASVCPAGSFADAEVRIWDVHRGRLLETLPGRMTMALFRPDGEQLLTTNAEDRVMLWNVGKDLLVDAFADTSEANVITAALSPDGHTIAIADDAGELQLWDAKSRRLLRSIRTHAIRSDPQLMGVDPVGIAFDGAVFSPDARRIAVPLPQGGLAIADVESGHALTILADAGHVVFAAFAHDGRTLATISADGDGKVAELWDTTRGRKLHRLVAETTLREAAFSPDDRMLMTTHAGNGGTIWNVATGGTLSRFTGDRASFSPDGRLVATVATTPMIGGGFLEFSADLFDARTGRWVLGLKHENSVGDAGFSPDGRLLVTAGYDGAARVFDVRTGKRVLLLEHGVPVLRAVFSPDGGRIATGDSGGTIRLWDAKRGQLLYILHGHGTEPRSIAFSARGDLLLSVATAPDLGVVRLWDVHTESEPSTRVAAEIERWVPPEVMNTVVRQTFDRAP